MEAHRRKIPIDHPDRSITREKLEYPTENVFLTYLSAISKIEHHKGNAGRPSAYGVRTVDSFADKAVYSSVRAYADQGLWGRYVDANNWYESFIKQAETTKDHKIQKIVDGSGTVLAYESVDLSNYTHQLKLTISGSTIKSTRDDASSPQISATDTTFTSGGFGGFSATSEKNDIFGFLDIRLLPPSSKLPFAKVILEMEMIENNGIFTPSFKQELVEISKLKGLPPFMYKEAKKYEILRKKGFTDEEIMILFDYIPQHQVDLASITWGAFEHSKEYPIAIITVVGDNPYKQGAIQKQIAHAKAKGLRVLKPPKDYREAIEQYRRLKADFPHWVVGKDNWAYQTLGHEIFDLFQVADTYHGNIVEGYKPNAYKKVPDWEMRKTLAMWKERLKRVSTLVEERDKHMKKLEEVEKKGW